MIDSTEAACITLGWLLDRPEESGYVEAIIEALKKRGLWNIEPLPEAQTKSHCTAAKPEPSADFPLTPMVADGELSVPLTVDQIKERMAILKAYAQLLCICRNPIAAMKCAKSKEQMTNVYYGLAWAAGQCDPGRDVTANGCLDNIIETKKALAKNPKLADRTPENDPLGALLAAFGS